MQKQKIALAPKGDVARTNDEIINEYFDAMQAEINPSVNYRVLMLEEGIYVTRDPFIAIEAASRACWATVNVYSLRAFKSTVTKAEYS